MNKWNGEKTVQVEPRGFTAFGIEIDSRYGNAQELLELIAFARECAECSVEDSVISASYDSKSCVCTFELKSSAPFGPMVAEKVLECAKATIGQFSWGEDEMIHHGGPMAGRPE